MSQPGAILASIAVGGVSDLAHAIQLSLAPVFLLTGIGAFLNKEKPKYI